MPPKVQVSCDGVSECRSNSVSLDVYSSRFFGCQKVYPHRIVRPLDKAYNDTNRHFELFLNDLKVNDIDIDAFVADNLKRAIAKCCLNHASLFPCEYCFAKGVRLLSEKKNYETFMNSMKMKQKIVQEKLTALQNDPVTNAAEIKTLKNVQKELVAEEKSGPKKRTNIVWPACTRNGESRTNEKILEIIDRIEENPNLSKDDRKGVVGRSPLWDIPNFNFVRDSPTEYMHAVCIGVVKRMLELTFAIGESRSRVTKRKLSSPSDFDILMLATKVVRECSRRARKLDFAVMKAQEMRNIILFFFPHILQCIEPNAKERRLWLLLVFMIRSCIIPSDEFHCIDLELLETVCKEFYSLYESLFGPVNCTYNTHIVGSHLIEMRAHGPLTLTSAFGFEDFYGEMRRAFVPGTQSTLKQIFQKILIKRAISNHCCQKPIYFSANDSAYECNSLIYCYEFHAHKIFKIISVEKDYLICYPLGKYPLKFKETQDLNINWSHVGVYRKGGIYESPVNVKKNKVSGKVLHVADYLITCPVNILREK